MRGISANDGKRTGVTAIARWLVEHRAWAVAVAIALGAVGTVGASRLGFEASYAALLSPDSPSVRELEQVKRDLDGGTSEIVLVLSGPAAPRDTLARDIAARLEEHPDIVRADAELPRGFFEARALYLIDRADLSDLAQLVDAAAGGGADAWRAVAQWAERIESRYDGGPIARALTAGERRYVFVRPRVTSAELGRARAIASDIRAVVDELRADTGVNVEYAGRLAVHLAEQQSTKRDLRRATVLALVLVVLLLSLVLRRLLAPLLLAAPLLLSLVVTLGAARVLVGDLNLLSAFILPALVGLGIDFGVHLYARFLDEVRASDDGDRWGERAMVRAIEATIGASATSAMTTAAAFGSLALVHFRGFREFGLLGAAGVAITLVVTYLVLPPLAVLATRRRPDVTSGGSRLRRVGRPRRVAIAVAAIGALATAWLGVRAADVRFVNDFDQLKGSSRAIELTEEIERDLGLMLAPAVFVVPDLDAARALEAAARDAKQARDPAARVGVAEVFSAARLVPVDAGDRARVLDRMRAQLSAARALAGADRAVALDRLIALTEARPYGIDDLPVQIRRRLVGAYSGDPIVLVWPDDSLYVDTVMRGWLAEVDRLRASLAASIGPERAAEVRVLDERRIPLEVVDVIGRDLPRALALAGALVLLALMAHFRRVGPVMIVAGAMVAALAWLFGVLVVTGVQLNVYNAVVVPCIVGIGIDNAIHLHHAYDRGGPGSLGRVLATTGAAAALASATTGIGFGAAMIARQGGLVSMGATALIGVCCALAATTALLPAVLCLREPRA